MSPEKNDDSNGVDEAWGAGSISELLEEVDSVRGGSAPDDDFTFGGFEVRDEGVETPTTEIVASVAKVSERGETDSDSKSPADKAMVGKLNPVPEEALTISAIAQRIGVPESTVRYYDQEFGDYLSKKPGKGKRRIYDGADYEQLVYIRYLAKKEGLAVKDIQNRLAEEAKLKEKMGFSFQEVINSVNGQIVDLNKRIDRLDDKLELVLTAVSTLLRRSNRK